MAWGLCGLPGIVLCKLIPSKHDTSITILEGSAKRTRWLYCSTASCRSLNRSTGTVATVRSPRSSRLARQCLGRCFTRFMGRESMESNPKFAIDLDDFESRLAQAIENERPAPLSIPSQISTNSTMGIPAPTVKLTPTIRRRSKVDQVVPSTQSTGRALDPVQAGRNVMVILSTICSSAICLALSKTIVGESNPSPWRMILLSVFASCWIGLVVRWIELTSVCGYDLAKRCGLRIATLVALAAYVGIAILGMNVSVLEALSLLGWSGLCRWGYESSLAFTSPADDAGKRAIGSSSLALAQQATRVPC